ncbi:MAG: Gfo/Idh/MocA family oxidoreductase [Steroidobacteraceae bacterium]|jgi:predicted dehydrogenase
MAKIRLGMVGGGQGGFIGAVHRIAARLDDEFELVAGALSSDPIRALDSANSIGIVEARAYTSYQRMAETEAKRSDGIEAVAIVTPNDSHADIATIFLNHGIHVICDKPLAVSVEQARMLGAAAAKSGKILAVTYNYRGYPLIRQARAMCVSREIGKIRIVEVEYLQDWLAERIEIGGSKGAQWRTDPERTGGAGAIGDIGVHAFDLARYVTGLRLDALSAELTSFVPGRRVDDDARVLLRFEDGAKGLLWASQVAIGNENGLAIRVYGDRGGLEWHQSEPNELWYSQLGSPTQKLTRGGPGISVAAGQATRLPAGHPEGYLEAFAFIYKEVAAAIRASQNATDRNDESSFAMAIDGIAGLNFIQAALLSSAGGGVWQAVEKPS